MRKSTLSMMRSLAKRRGGMCLSQRYVDSRTSLRWKCGSGHVWRAIPTNVTKGSWCPECAHRKPLTIREMRVIAAARGGRCLSTRYVNNQTKLMWKCLAGHEWAATPALVKKGGWCPYCARVIRLSLEAMQAVARRRNGRCLSTEYINIKTRCCGDVNGVITGKQTPLRFGEAAGAPSAPAPSVCG